MEIEFQPVKRSDTLDAVAFYPEYGDLLIRFKSRGAIYRYRHADEHLAHLLMVTPHPWSKFRSVVNELEYEKVSSGLRTQPAKRRAPKIVATTEIQAPAAQESVDNPKVIATPAKAKHKKADEPATIKATTSRKPRVKKTETADVI